MEWGEEMEESKKQRFPNIHSKAGRDLAFSLLVQANILSEYSADPNNPNVSAWLRSGAITMIELIEKEIILDDS